MEVKQFKYDDSNLAYLVWSGREAAAIDGGAVDEILDFIKTENLELKYVLNTHEHHDHIPGNAALLSHTKAEFLNPKQLRELKHVSLENEQIEIFHTPGHTHDSIVFYFDDILVTGDTLFNGTVGNCYTEDYETYFNSLQKVLSFPPETRVLAGHDLVDYALGVAERIDPGNRYIESYRKKYSPEKVESSLESELRVNPFIRFNDPALDEFRRTLDLPLDTPYERWRAMMSVH